MGRGNSPFWYEYGNTGRPGFGKASTHVPLRELALEQKPKHGNRQGVDCEVPDGLAELALIHILRAHETRHDIVCRLLLVK